MDILVVLGHPRPGSFNHAIAEVVLTTLRERGHRASFHDLCQEGFDPALPAKEMLEQGPVPDAVARHCRELAAADGIVIVHPNWWGQPPAVLTGWIDRVFRPGVAYRFEGEDGGEGVPLGLQQDVAAGGTGGLGERSQGLVGALRRWCVVGHG